MKIQPRQLRTPIKNVSANYSVTVYDAAIVCNSATPFTVILITATGSGNVYEIINIGTGGVTISKSGDLIDGAASQIALQYDTIAVRDIAANQWKMV